MSPRARAFAALVLGSLSVSLLLSLPACREKTAGYCCTSGATCPDIVMCDAPLVCDMGTRECIDAASQPDASIGGACSASMPCESPITPRCDEQQDLCVGCMAEGDCAAFVAGGLPHCGPNAACVECRPAEATDCDAGGAEPVCDEESFTCRACRADDECAGGLCDEGTGLCVADQDIVFVDGTTGSTDAACGTRAMPCKDLSDGVGKAGVGTRVWVVVAPLAMGYLDQVVISGKVVRIVAPGVSMRPELNGVPGLRVEGGADVSVEGLTIHDAGLAAGHGFSCAGTAGDTKLTLAGVTSEKNEGHGLSVFECAVVVSDSSFVDNVLLGANVVQATLEARRSRFLGNDGGGLSLVQCDFTVESSLFAGNGSGATQFGGVRLNIPATVAGPHVFAFNTVTGNTATAAQPGGVTCLGGAFVVESSIVWANAGLAAQTDAGCTLRFSDVGPAAMAPAGEMNLAVDPMFVNAGGGDFHLMPMSPVIDKADPATPAGGHDLDGQARVQGGRADMGADEAK